jgi:predicted ATPase
MQRASVVGRIFWESAVAHMSEKDGTTAGAVASMLNDLRRREMVFKREESAFEGTAEYGFRHAILRDVVYETIVPRQRREYHKQVAEWLIDAGKDRLDEYNMLIAEHYERADENSEAAKFLSQSATAYFALGSGRDASKVLLKALKMLEGTDYTAQRADIQVQLGTVYAIQGQYQNARAQLEPALEQARQIGDRRVQALALAELARTVGMWQADYEAGMSTALGRYFRSRDSMRTLSSPMTRESSSLSGSGIAACNRCSY